MTDDVKIYMPSKTGEVLHASYADVNIVLGPVGSGKSTMMCADIMMRCLSLPICKDGVRRARVAILRNTYPELRSTTIKTWLDWYPEAQYGRLKYTSPICQFMSLPDEHGVLCEFEFLFLALDSAADEKKLLSLEVSFIWINEVREMKENIFEACCERVGRYPAKTSFPPEVVAQLELQSRRKEDNPSCSNQPNDIVFCVNADTNAPNETHWLVENYWEKLKHLPRFLMIKQPAPLIRQQDGSYIINPDAENIENLNKGYSYYLDMLQTSRKERFNVMVMVMFGAYFTGVRIYNNYNPQIHRAPYDIKPVHGHRLYLGFDFGRTPACIIIQIIDGQFRILDELVAGKKNKLESIGLDDFIAAFVEPTLMSEKYKDFHDITTIGDPSGNGRNDTDDRYCLEVLNKAGLNAHGCYTQSPVRRIESMDYFLSRNVMGQPCFLMSHSCVMLHEAFEGGYEWKAFTNMATGQKVVSDQPNKNRFSHPMEAAQYVAVESIYQATQPEAEEPGGFFSPTGQYIIPPR